MRLGALFAAVALLGCKDRPARRPAAAPPAAMIDAAAPVLERRPIMDDGEVEEDEHAGTAEPAGSGRP